jgi:transposase
MHKHSKLEPTRQSAGRPQVRKAKKRLWIGVDLGNRFSHVCFVDDNGEIADQARVRTNPKAMSEFFGAFAGCAIAIEASGHSPWVSRVLSECGLDVTVANAREVRKIHQSDRKNDRSDAETLARLLRADRKLLAPIEHRSETMQADISALRARDTVVRARTACINTIRGLAKTIGVQLPKCSAPVFAHRVKMLIPQELQATLSPLLETIAHLSAQIKAYEKMIETLAREKYPETTALSQVTGVGALTSLAFVLTVGDKNRFTSSRDLGPYLGLVPRQYDSGDKRSQLGITKHGNGFLRRLLVNSAQYILGPFGPDCRLRRHGERLTQRGGNNAKKRAVVAVARKLAILLHYLWKTGAVYQPLYGAAQQPVAA